MSHALSSNQFLNVLLVSVVSVGSEAQVHAANCFFQSSHTPQLNFSQVLLLVALTVQDETKSNTPWSRACG